MVIKILNIIASSNLVVALGVWSLVMLTGITNNTDVIVFANFSFFATLSVYSFSFLSHYISTLNINFLKYVSFLIKKEQKLNSKSYFHFIILVVSSVTSVLFLKTLRLDTLVLLVPVVIVSLFYSLSVVKHNSKYITLREFPYVKIFLIAFSWAFITVVLPLINSDLDFTYFNFIEFIVRFLFVIAITIPFDIRDVKTDKPSLYTIPQLVGEENSKKISYLFIFINMLFYMILYKKIEVVVFILFFAILTSLLVKFTNKNRNQIYYSLVIESTSILLYLVFFVVDRFIL